MKRIIKIALTLSLMLIACMSVSAANLITEVETNDNKVTIKYFLDSMPTDIKEISSIRIFITLRVGVSKRIVFKDARLFSKGTSDNTFW